jgi:hypothetical protein
MINVVEFIYPSMFQISSTVQPHIQSKLMAFSGSLRVVEFLLIE